MLEQLTTIGTGSSRPALFSAKTVPPARFNCGCTEGGGTYDESLY